VSFRCRLSGSNWPLGVKTICPPSVFLTVDCVHAGGKRRVEEVQPKEPVSTLGSNQKLKPRGQVYPKGPSTTQVYQFWPSSTQGAKFTPRGELSSVNVPPLLRPFLPDCFFGSATPCSSPPHWPSIFSDYSFCVHRLVNQDGRHLLVSAMAFDLSVTWQFLSLST
jgi:hypothetical protein